MTTKKLVRIFRQTKTDLPFEKFAKINDPDFVFDVCDDVVYQKCDVAILYGTEKPEITGGKTGIKNSIYSQHQGPIIVIETGFIGRRIKQLSFTRRLRTALKRQGKAFGSVHELYRVGINGAFGDDADFCNANSPSDRWQDQAKRFGISVKPYRTSGTHVLLIGQVPGDASLRGLSMLDWIIESARYIRTTSGRQVRVRLHPNSDVSFISHADSAISKLDGVELLPVAMRSLEIDLQDCWVCVTYSSSSSVDALLAGVPAICLSPANIAYQLCSKSLDDVNAPLMPDREQWLYNLAYAQWSPYEIGDGLPWLHLREGVKARL